MANSVIEQQLARLAKFDNPDGIIDGQGGSDEAGAGAPSAQPAHGVPGQEPHAGGGVGAGPGAQAAGSGTQPASGTGEVEALKQANADLTRQVAEFKQLYERQHGMVAPLQRKTAEQDKTIQDLTRKVEDLQMRLQAAGSNQPPNSQATPPAQVDTDDPRLKEFLDLYGDMIPGLEAFLQTKLGAIVQPQMEQVKPAIELANKAKRDAMLADHLAPLYVKHPQAGNIIRSEAFAKWVESKPSYIRDSIVDTVTNPENYPVAKVISIFDDFSEDTKAPAQPAQPQGSMPSPGEMVVDVRRVPTSSTPGGTPLPQPLTRERLAQLNRALTVDRSIYTQDQIAAFKAELELGESASNAAGYGLAPRMDTLTR